MAATKAKRSHAEKKYQHVVKLAKATGKIVADAALYVSPDYYYIEIRFDDKTALVFDWTTGNYKPVRRWRPVHSRSFEP